MVRSSSLSTKELSVDSRSRSGEVGGAQSIQRALHLLRHVAAQTGGARLSEVAATLGLNKATCHRILSALVAEGFLQFDRARMKYELGSETVLLGWIARARQDIPALARRSLERICQTTGDTAFLSIRSGNEAVCVDRHVGDYPIKTLTLEVGSRRPLGVGAGSMALLAFLPEDELHATIAAAAPLFESLEGMTADFVESLALASRAQGFVFNEGYVIPGMSALGVPVFDGAGRPAAALSVAAITARMSDDRRVEIVKLLREEAETLSRTLSGEARDPAIAN